MNDSVTKASDPLDPDRDLAGEVPTNRVVDEPVARASAPETPESGTARAQRPDPGEYMWWSPFLHDYSGAYDMLDPTDEGAIAKMLEELKPLSTAPPGKYVWFLVEQGKRETARFNDEPSALDAAAEAVRAGVPWFWVVQQTGRAKG